MNAPCLDCEDRHFKCHSSCEKYIAYREERRKISKERHHNTNITSHFMEEALKKRKLWKK